MVVQRVIAGTLYDGVTDVRQKDKLIEVSDGRIVSVSPIDRESFEGTQNIIDASNYFVIPGLIDANVHLVSARTPDTLLEFFTSYHDLVIEAAQIGLKHGVTSLCDTWGPTEITREVRDRINARSVVAATIYFGGNILGLKGPLSDDFFPTGNAFSAATLDEINKLWEAGVSRNLLSLNPDDLFRTVLRYGIENDVDFIKYAGSNHSLTDPLLMFSESAQAAIVRAARELGVSVQAHTAHLESLRLEVEAGVDLLQHPEITADSLISSSFAKEIAANDIPAGMLLRTQRHVKWVKDQCIASIGNLQQRRDQNIDTLLENGVRPLLNTDAFAYGTRVRNHDGFRRTIRTDVPDMPSQLGEAHFLWLEAAFEKGITGYSALKAVTSDVAKAYRLEDDIGSIEIGKKADLLILEKDPLLCSQNYRSIRHIIKDGDNVDRNALPTRRLLCNTVS